jgi:hypothetical protein
MAIFRAFCVRTRRDLASMQMPQKRVVIIVVVLSLIAASAAAADLQPRTVAAFDRYVRVTEAQVTADPFLRIDGLREPDRKARLADLARGELWIERLVTQDAGKQIDVPGGLIHHWVGAVFIPGAKLDQAVALLQDYDHHAQIYQPRVVRSKLLSRNGDVFQVFLRFSMKKVITVVVNTDNEARFTRPAPDRAQSRIYSTRVAEVDNPDTPQEREEPVGHDGGYLWRLYTYWRFLERDGGTYLQCEAITLTRGIPMGFGWMIGPFVTSIPRESLVFTLEKTKETLMKR